MVFDIKILQKLYNEIGKEYLQFITIIIMNCYKKINAQQGD